MQAAPFVGREEAMLGDTLGDFAQRPVMVDAHEGRAPGVLSRSYLPAWRNARVLLSRTALPHVRRKQDQSQRLIHSSVYHALQIVSNALPIVQIRNSEGDWF